MIKKKTNFVLIFVCFVLLLSLPVILLNKKINKKYNERDIEEKIVFYKTNIDNIINNIEDVKKELESNKNKIKDKEFILTKLNDGMKQYDGVSDSKLFNEFSKINNLLEKSQINIISLIYLDGNFILDLLIKNQNDLDELKQMNYKINKINYENNLFLINMTIGANIE